MQYNLNFKTISNQFHEYVFINWKGHYSIEKFQNMANKLLCEGHIQMKEAWAELVSSNGRLNCESLHILHSNFKDYLAWIHLFQNSLF